MPGRVGSRRQFERLARSSRRGRGTCLRVQYVDQTDSPARVAVAYSISRRVGGAVVRNRQRRRLRSLMDELDASVRSGSYLITCSIGARSLSYDDLRSDLLAALGDADVLT